MMRRNILAITLAAAAFTVIAAESLHASGHDLAGSVMFMRRGFSRDWISVLPGEDGNWIRKEPGAKGLFPLRVKDLGFRDLPARRFFSFARYRDEEFTFITSFDMPGNSPLREGFPGLFLAQVGINWEVYLNGRLLHREMYTSADGTISKGRNVRLQLLPVHPSLLKEGRNTLAFRVTGNPTLPDTGFYRNGPYLVGDYRDLEPLTRETESLILLFFYLGLGLYHIFLYTNRTEARYNLYFGLFSVGLFIYNIVRTRAVYAVISDTNLLTTIELLSLYTLIPLMGSFLELILQKRLTLFTKIYAGFSGVLVALTLVAPLSTDIDFLRIWQATAGVPMLYYLVFVVGRTYYKNVGMLRAPGGTVVRGYFPALGRALVGTVAGNLLLGCIVMVGCAAFDIIDAVYFSSTLSLAKYGFFIFIIGIALILANRFLYIHGKVESLNTDLERNIRDLREANRLIGLSEEKYKLLVEGSNDMIFSLDEGLNFITVNRAVNALLRYNPDQVLKMNFMDMIHESPALTSFSKQIVREKLEQFVRTREPLLFKIQMKTAYSSEPKDMQVRIENIKVDGKNEIIGKATSILEDSLLNSFVSENQKYVIGNFITIAEEMSYRMTRNLSAFIDVRDGKLLRIALFEVLINAIEHGNLAISFDEKTEAAVKGNYIEFLSERRNNPRFAGKRVRIEYSVNSERVVYIVTDEGEGFDHVGILSEDSGRANEEMLSHGRGITMAKNIFDRVKFSERGNQVMMIKYFRETKEASG